MQLVEIRDLDGPNVFLLEPAIKVEFAIDDADESPDALASRAIWLEPLLGNPNPLPIAKQLIEAVVATHAQCGLPAPNTIWQPLETPGHFALAFGWSHRRFASGVAEYLAAAACGQDDFGPAQLEELRALLRQTDPTDAPLMVPNADRSMPVVSITGTNGKTTTTRLIAHILRKAGLHVGWSSSTGVFIDGEQVMEGDYTGPSGALRVLTDPGVDTAVLETARGGILLRGIAYESNDISVFTNVSADHLDLQGIRTIEGLAHTKATLIRITKPDGYAVLNADDPLVVKQAQKTPARVFFVARKEGNEVVNRHVNHGENALILDGKDVIWWHDRSTMVLTDVSSIPIALNGNAPHMLENALCGAAACLGLGLDPELVREGLKTFSNSPSDNLGRLNIYDVNGTTVVVDFAHNEAGLRHLLALAMGMKEPSKTLTAIIGTAGDRTNANLRAIGRLAAETSDHVIVKETTKYLRGRIHNDEMNEHYVAGIQEGGKNEWTILPSEIDALKAALDRANAGDVIAVMCVEQVQEVHDFLHAIGAESNLGRVTPN